MEGSEGRGGDAYTGSEDMIVDVLLLCGLMWLEKEVRRWWAELVVSGGRAVVFVGMESVGRDMAWENGSGY